ncbi:MAG: MerR family transcriptional regulator [Mogibacterium sp.]|nr:MerR family transcriptional regulator [Mogibacterium sp.]
MKKADLFSIGEVSRITGVHIKSLRYYDRIGVFTPSYTDENTGYRYYSFDQLQNILAVRTCLDSGIALNNLESYMQNGVIDYMSLLKEASARVEQAMDLLRRRTVYLDFMKQEVSFNDASGGTGSRDCYGSIALWLTPFDGDINTFDRKANYLKLAEDARKHGFQISPIYFGMLMKCSGNERRLYLMAGLEDFLKIDEDNDHIFRTPETWYSCVSRPDLDVRAAESVWPDYFEAEYDKVVLSTVSIHSNHSQPVYSMFINKPSGQSPL